MNVKKLYLWGIAVLSNVPINRRKYSSQSYLFPWKYSTLVTAVFIKEIWQGSIWKQVWVNWNTDLFSLDYGQQDGSIGLDWLSGMLVNQTLADFEIKDPNWHFFLRSFLHIAQNPSEHDNGHLWYFATENYINHFIWF